MKQRKKRKIKPLRLLRSCLLLLLMIGAARYLLAYTASPAPAEPADAALATETPAAQNPYTDRLRAYKKQHPKLRGQIDKILKNPDAYPAKYLELLLRNPETADFVAAYPDHGQTGGNAPITLTEGEIPLLLQWDQRWGYESYGESCIAVSGCGPTCLSMVYMGLTGDTTRTPKEMADFSNRRGYYSSAGTAWELMETGAQALGLSVHTPVLTETAIKNALAAGHPVIMSLGPGDFTDEGHFIVVSGVAKNGDFIIRDPNSPKRSEKTWSADRLLPQVLNLWAFSYDA